MKYSNFPPAEPGYYWLKRGEDEEVVEIWTDPNASGGTDRIYFVHQCGSGSATEVTNVQNALWSGPIPKPES